MFRSSAYRNRSGFTLIELIVVVAIIGVLVALLLPAVQKVREAANGLRCRNNLKQIALATLQFQNDHGAFPPARIVERPLGFDPADRRCGGSHPSWLVRILPYLEQENAFRAWDLSLPYADHPAEVRARAVPAYFCPSRRSAGEAVSESDVGPPIVLPCGCRFPGIPVAGGLIGDYGGNHGDLSPGSSGLATDFYWGGNGTGVLISSRAICSGDRPGTWVDRVRMSDITDGASNTLLAGEMHLQRERLGRLPENGPLFDGSRFSNFTRVGGPGVPIAAGPEDDVAGMALFAFGSWHPGGCHFAACDGRVLTVRPNISTTTLARLCNRGDGNPAESD